MISHLDFYHNATHCFRLSWHLLTIKRLRKACEMETNDGDAFVSTAEVPLLNEPLESFDRLLQAAKEKEEGLREELHQAHNAVEEERRHRAQRRADLLRELEALHQPQGGPLEPNGSAPLIEFGSAQQQLSRRMELRELTNVIHEEEREMLLEVRALETEVAELRSYANSKAARAEREAKRAASVAQMVEQLTSLRNAAAYERSHRKTAVGDARRAAQAQFEGTVIRQQSEIATLEGKIRALDRVHTSLQNAIYHHSVTAAGTSADASSVIQAAHQNLEEQLRSPIVGSGSKKQSPSRIVLPGYVLQSDESLGRNQSSTMLYLREDPNL